MSQDYRDPLITFLEDHKEDRAMLAALRRGLGKKAGEVPAMFPYLVPFTNRDKYMLAALFALHPISTESGNMGTHLRTLIQASEGANEDATSRRFVQLLRMGRNNLEPRLRQHINILKSNDIAINWHQLSSDVRYWDSPNNLIQRRWAEAFWK